MKKLLLAFLFLTFSSPTAFAGGCVINGVYDIQYDKVLNGKLDQGFMTAQINLRQGKKNDDRFHGKYVHPYRDHAYNGRCFTLEKSVISMFYHDKGNGYFSTYALKEIGKDKFQGSWTDVRGNIGDFIMTKSTK